MLTGAHIILYSNDADADRAFFRDVLDLDHVDAGEGWLIFALPPSEVAVHPTMPGATGSHELYLMVDDVERFVAQLDEQDVPHGEISDQGWGRLVAITLPGGSELGIYEPRHPLAHD